MEYQFYPQRRPVLGLHIIRSLAKSKTYLL